MTDVRWSQQALLDLDDMALWLAPRNPAAAQKAEADIRSAVIAIAKRPLAWPQVRDLDARYRSLPKWKRRILFQIKDDFILIISIKHTRQSTSP